MTRVAENEFGFTFAGIHSREFNIRVVDIKRNIFPLLTENVQTVPGMRGNIYQGTSLQSKSFDVDIVIVAGSLAERVDLVHQISQWLIPSSIGEFELIFDDEQDYSYYAHVTASSQLENQLFRGKTTITFTCSDPQCYGLQKTLTVDKNPFTITPDGGGECYPVFSCIPKKDVPKIAVTDQDGNYVYIGEDVDPDTQGSPVNNYPRVVNDPCNSFATGWQSTTDPSFMIENGKVGTGAAMESTSDVFRIKDNKEFGANMGSYWHGACYVRSFPAVYDDWKIRIRLYNKQYYHRARGKIEVYLLDSSGQRIGRVYLKDNGNGEDVWVLAEVGTHTDSKNIHHALIYTQGKVNDKKKKYIKVKYKNGTKKVKKNGKTKTETVWKTAKLPDEGDTDTYTNFYGYIQLQKIGNKFTAEVMKLNGDTHQPVWSKPVTATFTDTKNQFTKSLAGCALYIGKYDITEDSKGVSYTNNAMGLTNLEVWNILNGGVDPSDNPTIIAQAGDEVQINCEDGQIYKNSEPYMRHLFIGSNFPVMKGGTVTTYGFEPSLDDADWTITYRPTHG